MALKIVWTKRAEIGFDKIVNYLETHFTEKEVRKFIHQSNKFFILLCEYPEMLERTSKHENVRRGPINKHTILTYRIKSKKKQIELINIRMAKQKPIN